MDLRAFSRARAKTGKRIAAKIAMMAMTTSNSISVNASRLLLHMSRLPPRDRESIRDERAQHIKSSARPLTPRPLGRGAFPSAPAPDRHAAGARDYLTGDLPPPSKSSSPSSVLFTGYQAPPAGWQGPVQRPRPERDSPTKRGILRSHPALPFLSRRPRERSAHTAKSTAKVAKQTPWPTRLTSCCAPRMVSATPRSRQT